MSGPEEIEERLANVREIGEIVAAMHAMAIGHQQEARGHLDAIRGHAAGIATALSSTLALHRGGFAPEAVDGVSVAIIVGAAQGFSGAYAQRMAEAAKAVAAADTALFVVGGRTRSTLEEAGLKIEWFVEMAPHAEEVPDLASRLADALFRHIAKQGANRVTLVYADPASEGLTPVRRSLLPFDYNRFPPSQAAPPLTTLPTTELLATLVDEYVFTELCETLMLGFAAESAARATAMARARKNVKDMVTELKGEFQRERQEQMTTEIIEVAGAGTLGPST